MSKKFSEEQKQNAIASVKADVALGMKIKDACKKNKVKLPSYYRWNTPAAVSSAPSKVVTYNSRTLAPKKYKAKEVRSEAQTMSLLMGTPEQITAFLRGSQ